MECEYKDLCKTCFYDDNKNKCKDLFSFNVLRVKSFQDGYKKGRESIISESDISKDQTSKIRTMLEKLAYDLRHSAIDMEGIEKVINKFNKEFGG